MEIDAASAVRLTALLLRALGSRALQMLSLVMTFGLFCWAMWLQEWLAFAIAGAFGLGVLWPVLAFGWSATRGTKNPPAEG